MRNIYTLDRILRIILAIVLLYFSKTSLDLFTLAALILFATAFMGFCPTYSLFSINSRFAKKNDFLTHLPKYNPEPVFIFCPKGTCVFRNDAAKKILPKVNHFSALSQKAPKELIQENSTFSVQYTNDEKTYLIHAIGVKEKSHILAYGFNITDILKSKQALKEQLITDPLTNLGNTKRLLKDLESIQGNSLVLMVFDIIKFSQINSFFGHQKADELLRLFALALQDFSKKTLHVDSVYRLRANTFALLGSFDTNCKEDYKQKIYPIKNALLQTIKSLNMSVDGVAIPIDIRLGLTCTNSDALNTDPSSLLNQAETALSEAKKDDIHELHYNNIKHINDRYEKNISWAAKLHQIASGKSEAKFQTHFQAIYNLHTEKIEKFESLIRIEDKEDIISPYLFLDVAKQINLLPTITRHVVTQAVQMFQNKAFEFSINITAQDFQDDSFIPWIDAYIKSNKLQSNRVVLELLEDEDVYEHSEKIARLKALGFKIAIDDFGVGYSNFKNLQLLNVDYIKIDGSLIKNILNNPKDILIIKSICTYAKSIGAQTIAEFVSSKEIFDQLSTCGVDYAQGYFIGAPSKTPQETIHAQ